MRTSKKVLVAPNWVDLVDWKRRKVVMDLTTDQIESCPEHDPALPVNREYEVRLYDFYRRPTTGRGEPIGKPL